MTEATVVIPPEYSSPHPPMELVAQWKKNELTGEEKTRPEARYYYDALAAPDPENLRMMESPCDPSKILWPERINDLLNPGYLEIETGWCQMPNGGGFIANLTRMPGVTAKMAYWWWTWFTLTNLRYKIWYRPSHLGHFISPERRKIILDPKSRIPEDTVWGATHHAVEDIGMGPEIIDIHFKSPEEMGFDMSRFHPPNVSGLIGGYGDEMMMLVPGAPRGCAVMCHILRDVPGGVEWRTRFWMGYRLQNRKTDFCVPPGVQVPAEAIRGLAIHNVMEFSNFAVMLPKVYKEFGGKPIG